MKFLIENECGIFDPEVEKVLIKDKKTTSRIIADLIVGLFMLGFYCILGFILLIFLLSGFLTIPAILIICLILRKR